MYIYLKCKFRKVRKVQAQFKGADAMWVFLRSLFYFIFSGKKGGGRER